MASLLELITGVLELLSSWRLLVGLTMAVIVCLLLAEAVPDGTATWLVCVPVALVGVYFSFRWQLRADSRG